MNLWGFDRSTAVGPGKGAYFHPNFQRDEALVVEKLRRVRAIPKIPAKERRRRQALIRQQDQSHSQSSQPPPLLQTNATMKPQHSVKNHREGTEMDHDDDGLSTLLGVAETLSALRQQPPRGGTEASLPVSTSSVPTPLAGQTRRRRPMHTLGN